MFGTRQQFWLASIETGVLTPTQHLFRTSPALKQTSVSHHWDIGTTIGFVSKTPDYSKLMIMQGQGNQIDPVVLRSVRLSQVGCLTTFIVWLSVHRTPLLLHWWRWWRSSTSIVFYNDGQLRIKCKPGVNGLCLVPSRIYRLSMTCVLWLTTRWQICPVNGQLEHSEQIRYAA